MKNKFTIIIPPVLAAAPIPPDSGKGLGCGGDMGPIAEAMCKLTGGTGDIKVVGDRLNTALSGVIGFMTVIAGLWFMFQIIIAGYGWISAGGDKQKIETAGKKITNSLVGIVIIVAAWVIIGIVGKVIGLNILDPGAVLQNLGI